MGAVPATFCPSHHWFGNRGQHIMLFFLVSPFKRVYWVTCLQCITTEHPSNWMIFTTRAAPSRTRRKWPNQVFTAEFHALSSASWPTNRKKKASAQFQGISLSLYRVCMREEVVCVREQRYYTTTNGWHCSLSFRWLSRMTWIFSMPRNLNLVFLYMSSLSYPVCFVLLLPTSNTK